MDNLSYLFAAFAIVWAMVFAYILVLSRRQKQLGRKIESLMVEIQEAQDK